jgi:hypothetical protein
VSKFINLYEDNCHSPKVLNTFDEALLDALTTDGFEYVKKSSYENTMEIHEDGFIESFDLSSKIDDEAQERNESDREEREKYGDQEIPSYNPFSGRT